MTQSHGTPRRWDLLALLSLVVAVIWLVVLPRLQALPAMQSRIDQLERQGIDPSAMFYTELEMMNSRRQAHQH